MKIPNRLSRGQVITLLLAAFLVGAAIASIFWHTRDTAVIRDISENIKPMRQQNNPYQFINPLLGYEVPGNIKEFNAYQPLEDQITKTVTQAQNNSLNSYSVYFRDLTSGRWVGINENTAYAPASMMKVAIMIAYYKDAENDPGLLQKTFAYSQDAAGQINEVSFETASNLQVGASYTVEQLIEAMIINSDNGAKNVLLDNINQNSLNEIYSDLSLPNPANSANYTITPKQYALLLRILYNATYLSRNSSEQALKIMSQAQYSQGLVAGVPTSVIVAQKFGENVDSSTGTTIISLSNCGVIYHPTHPYILCVMTKGNDVNGLAKAIASISQTVWNNVNSYARSQNY